MVSDQEEWKKICEDRVMEIARTAKIDLHYIPDALKDMAIEANENMAKRHTHKLPEGWKIVTSVQPETELDELDIDEHIKDLARKMSDELKERHKTRLSRRYNLPPDLTDEERRMISGQDKPISTLNPDGKSRACDCGARHTSFPNHHMIYCKMREFQK